MSRSFEVLERVQRDQELFQVPLVTKAAPASGRRTSGKVSIPDPDALAREEVRRLVQCLFLATNGKGRNVSRRVVFCGIDEAQGSNLMCTLVGRCLAEQVQSQVCVVDANTCVPGSKPLFDLASSDSSTQPESGNAPKFSRQVTDNLWLVSIGSVATNDGTRILDQVRMSIRDMGEFAYIVISAPPIRLYSDVVLLGQMSDGVVLVLEANSTRRLVALNAKKALEEGNVRVLGTVLNNRTFPIPEAIYRRL